MTLATLNSEFIFENFFFKFMKLSITGILTQTLKRTLANSICCRTLTTTTTTTATPPPTPPKDQFFIETKTST